MASLMEITQLCRLCLVKDQVNIPIFEEPGDIRQIFLKISACLPVKVAREDNLPKKICDGCSYKLEMFYEFWNTSASSEKQLLKWLEQVGIDKLPTSSDKSAQPQSHSINTDGVVLKQEVLDLGETHGDDDELPTDDLNVPTDPEYLLQQQSYQSFEFQTDGFNEGETASAAGPSSTITSGAAASAAPKRKRRAAAMKPLPPQNDSEDEDDTGLIEPKIAKTEEQSDDSAGEDHEPTTFVGLPDDNEQPGPSGVGKAATSSDAPSSTVSPFKCEVCQKTHSSQLQLNNHLRYYHSLQPTTLEIGTFNCFVCDEPYETKRGLWNHEKLHGSKNFECNICGTVIGSKPKLIVHKKRHSNDYTHKCSQCDKGYFSMMSLKVHLDVAHGGVRYNCEKCGKVFKDRNYFLWHFKNHDKPLLEYKKKQRQKKVCHECGKVLSSNYSLNIHLNIHTGERPYVCVTCGKSFSSPSAYKVHLRQHSGVKPYKCALCDQTFTIRNSLLVHTRIHAGDKPYECQICQKRFVARSRLNKHMKVHGSTLSEEQLKPHLCTVCNKRFRYKRVLIDHERSHTGERPFLCSDCPKAFISKAVLRKHMKLHITDVK